jgi:hypothetical protein
MNSNLMPITTMMRAKMRIVMTMNLNLKANASRVCQHWGKRKLAHSGVQQWEEHLMWSWLGEANGSR